MSKSNIFEYINGLEKGKRYLTVKGELNYYLGPAPLQYTGVFVGKEGEELVFKDVMSHTAPFAPKGSPLRKRNGISKISIERVTADKDVLPFHPETGLPIQIDSDDDLKNIMEVLD